MRARLYTSRAMEPGVKYDDVDSNVVRQARDVVRLDFTEPA
jgi:hypothetical protein